MSKKIGKNFAELDGDVVRIRVDSRAHGELWILIDACDWEIVRDHRWHAQRHCNTFYARTNVRRPDGGRTTLKIHRLILGLPPGMVPQVDHVDGNGLDNRRENLRLTDNAGNSHNQHGKRPHKNGTVPTSRYPGVTWHKRMGKWMAQIKLDGRRIHLLYSDDELVAARSYELAKECRDLGGTRDEIRAAARLAAAV